MLFDKDAGHHTFLEDIYECNSRNIPGGTWGPATRPWSDVVCRFSLYLCLGYNNTGLTCGPMYEVDYDNLTCYVLNLQISVKLFFFSTHYLSRYLLEHPPL